MNTISLQLNPWQHIPFQFSVHLLETKNSRPKNFSFLALNNKDPRPDFISELKKAINNPGVILVFYQSFEKNVLLKLAENYPSEKKWIASILDKIVDLHYPFKNFFYYNPKQKGSASLKSVLPALTNKGYDDFEINNGELASLSFLDLINENTSIKQKEIIRNNLLKYCQRDTEGMIWIIDKLRQNITN